jgi:hypothetical protein
MADFVRKNIYDKVVEERNKALKGLQESCSYNELLLKIKSLEKQLEQAKALLKIATCPCCDGCGAYPDEYGEPIQCQWCDERDGLIKDG